ncbi:uncharacterized protein LW94_4818 [Fusarium fujikuroi]|nr:uncharacterized protein LW94_4818 [Fusarium fujikuroi]
MGSAERRLGALVITWSHDDHYQEPLTSGIADLQWWINTGYWDHDPDIPLPVAGDDTIQSSAGTATCYEAPSFNDTSPAVEQYQSVEPDNAQVRLRLLPGSLQPSFVHTPVSILEPSSPSRSTAALCDNSSSLSSTAIVPYGSRASPPALSRPASQPCDFCGAFFDNAAYLCFKPFSLKTISLRKKDLCDPW